MGEQVSWYSADGLSQIIYTDSSPLPSAECLFRLQVALNCPARTAREHVLLAVVERELERLRLERSEWHKAGGGRVTNELLSSIKRRRHQRPVEEQVGCAINSLPLPILELILSHAAKVGTMGIDRRWDCDVEVLYTIESVCRLWQALVRPWPHEAIRGPSWLDINTVLEAPTDQQVVDALYLDLPDLEDCVCYSVA